MDGYKDRQQDRKHLPEWTFIGRSGLVRHLTAETQRLHPDRYIPIYTYIYLYNKSCQLLSTAMTLAKDASILPHDSLHSTFRCPLFAKHLSCCASEVTQAADHETCPAGSIYISSAAPKKQAASSLQGSRRLCRDLPL